MDNEGILIFKTLGISKLQYIAFMAQVIQNYQNYPTAKIYPKQNSYGNQAHQK